MEEKLSTIYDETPKIEIQINEVPIKEEISIDVQDRYHHGYMTGFPYQKNIDGYFIHKKKQKEIIWGQLLSPQTCCSSASKDEIIWKVMFWVGITFAFGAIIVAFVKEEFEDKKNEDEDKKEHLHLYLSVLELVLAAISILISLSKHYIKYNSIIELQKKIRTIKYTDNTSGGLSNRQKLCLILGFMWFGFILVITVGFLIMHLYNKDSHKELEYTKFTTVIALFMVVVLDAVINDVISDAYTQAQSDQYKLIIHQLRLELNTHLMQTGSTERIQELEDFLNFSELFTLHEKHHFVKASHVEAFSTDGVKVRFDKTTGSVVLTACNKSQSH